MKIFPEINELPELGKPVVTIGTFDGVHIGHQQIIRRINKIARETGGESTLVTFHPHPRLVLGSQNQPLRLITTLEEKISLLEKYEIDNLIVASFTKAFSNLSAKEYIEDFLVAKLHPHKVVIGYDHHFGNDRKGNISLLKKLAPEHNYEVEEIPKQLIDDIAVSSTKIRRALEEGDIEAANSFLGHTFVLHGKVIPGDKRGREMGYPTANLHIDNEHKLIPALGIYAVKVEHKGNSYNGMLSIGNNPTFKEKGFSIEVNIFDFEKEVYGEVLKLHFIARMRDEKKFEAVEQLKFQLQKDKERALELLGQR